MALLPFWKRYETTKKAEELIEECCAHFNIPLKKLGKSGKDWIAKRNWDGEEDEMKRTVYAAVLTSSGSEILASNFLPRTIRDHEAYTKTQFENMALEEIVGHKLKYFFETLGSVEMKNIHGAVLTQIERPLIVESLKWAKGNQLKASRVLGINRNTLRKKMKDLGIK